MPSSELCEIKIFALTLRMFDAKFVEGFCWKMITRVTCSLYIFPCYCPLKDGIILLLSLFV